MGSMSLAPPAIFLKLDFPRNGFFVFSAPVINPLAFFTRKFCQVFLCHSYKITIIAENQNPMQIRRTPVTYKDNISVRKTQMEKMASYDIMVSRTRRPLI